MSSVWRIIMKGWEWKRETNMPVVAAEEIRAKRAQINKEIAQLEKDAVSKKVELRELKRYCSHPDLERGVTWMGSMSFSYCPDCAFSEASEIA